MGMNCYNADKARLPTAGCVRDDPQDFIGKSEINTCCWRRQITQRMAFEIPTTRINRNFTPPAT